MTNCPYCFRCDSPTILLLEVEQISLRKTKQKKTLQRVGFKSRYSEELPSSRISLTRLAGVAVPPEQEYVFSQ